MQSLSWMSAARITTEPPEGAKTLSKIKVGKTFTIIVQFRDKILSFYGCTHSII